MKNDFSLVLKNRDFNACVIVVILHYPAKSKFQALVSSVQKLKESLARERKLRRHYLIVCTLIERSS